MNEKSLKQIGWALKIKKQKVFFNDDQKDFLNEKFSIGKLTGKKEDPAKVSRDMPYVKKDGKHRFSKEEYLTPTQVAIFFFQDFLRKIENVTMEISWRRLPTRRGIF